MNYRKLMTVTFLFSPILVYGASLNIPQPVYCQSYVFLADAPSVPLRDRIPTGSVANVSGGVFEPAGDIIFDGSFTLRSNRTYTMTYKPDVSTLQTGVVMDANGTIYLQKWVTGVGNYTYTLDPENPPVTTTDNVFYASGGLMSGDLVLTNAGIIYAGTNGLSMYDRYSGGYKKIIAQDLTANGMTLTNISRLVLGDCVIDQSEGLITWDDTESINLSTRYLYDSAGNSVFNYDAGVFYKNLSMEGYSVTNLGSLNINRNVTNRMLYAGYAGGGSDYYGQLLFYHQNLLASGAALYLASNHNFTIAAPTGSGVSFADRFVTNITTIYSDNLVLQSNSTIIGPLTLGGYAYYADDAYLKMHCGPPSSNAVLHADQSFSYPPIYSPVIGARIFWGGSESSATNEILTAATQIADVIDYQTGYGIVCTTAETVQTLSGTFSVFTNAPDTLYVDGLNVDFSSSMCVISNIPSGRYLVDVSHSYLTSATTGADIIGALLYNGVVGSNAKFYKDTETVSGLAALHDMITFTGSATNRITYVLRTSDASTPTITTKALQMRVIR